MIVAFESMIILGLIISVIILIINNNKLSKDNIKYREILRENGLLSVINKPIEKVVSKPIKAEVKEEVRVVIKEKPKHSDKEIKNSFILIVGSILVVLAALIFLATTWDVTNNIFKAIMLFGMLFIFYFASYIAKRINLTQTYKAFHFITLAYIPISLISLWVFGLLGDYLSIDGHGSFVYLAICSFIVSIIYYIDAANKNSKVVGVLSFISLLLGLIFINCKLESRVEVFIFSVLIIGVILTILDKFKCYYVKESVNKAGISTSMFIGTYFHVLVSLGLLIFDKTIFLGAINTLLLLYLVYYNCKINNKMNIFNNVYQLLILLTFLNITSLVEYTFLKQLIMIGSFAVVCICDLAFNKKIKNSSFYELLAASFILYLFTFASNSIHSYIVIISFLIISLLFYYQDKEREKYKMYYASIISYIALLDIYNCYEFSILLLGYITLGAIGLLLVFNNKEYNPFKYVGYIFIFLLTFSLDFGSFGSILFLEFFTLVALVYSVYNYDKFNRIVSYIYLNISTLHLANYLGVTLFEEYMLIIPICNIFIVLSELILNEEKKTFNKELLYISYGISSFILICLNSEPIHLALMIINTILFCYYCKINNENKIYKYVPYVLAIPFMFFGKTLMIDGINYMNEISLLVVSMFAYMIYKTKDNKYTILYFVYLLLNSFVFDNNKYFILMLFAIGSLINYIYGKDKIKDLFKASLYTYLLIFTQFLVYDFDLRSISVLSYGAYILFAIIIVRDILKEHINYYKVFEYISLVLINLIAVNSFSSSEDGLIFVIFLIFIVIISYMLKYGPAFLVSLIFIVINSIILTKEFWLNLPWWLYVLLIGSSLIAFAVVNEVKDKKNTGELIKKLKDNLDL